MADRRLCLTGTPVQNKLDDVFALVKFLRLSPLDDKSVWTEYIGSPVKFGQEIGTDRIQAVMKCITLRRTKDSKNQDGHRILSLPPRKDKLVHLQFNEQERTIYDQFFNDSKAEFDEMSNKNEVMKNYVGILQKILRLRQICDHFELVEGKGWNADSTSYESIASAIEREGLNATRVAAIFGLLREAGTTQCVECGCELCAASDAAQGDALDTGDGATPKRTKKGRNNNTNTNSRGPTRASSPAVPPAIMTRCQHLFCIQCFQQCLFPGWPVPSPNNNNCPVCQTILSSQDALEVKADLPSDCNTKKKGNQKREKRPKGGTSLQYNPSTKVKALIHDLMLYSRQNPHSTNYDPSAVEIQMVDAAGNGLDDNVVKAVVLYVYRPLVMCTVDLSIVLQLAVDIHVGQVSWLYSEILPRH